jgi:hypothetical protein
MDEDLRHQMVYDAVVILASVEWAEKEIEKLLPKIDLAQKRNDPKEIEKLEFQLKTICLRLAKEDDNIEAYTKKYKEMVDNEKKKMLSNPRKKK